MKGIYKTKNDCNIFKTLRIQTGLTQAQVAERLNLNTSTISKWESGKTIPDQSILPAVAELYNTTIDYILGRDTIISVPSEYANVPVAFFDGIKDLSQEDINDVIKFIDYLKSKKN